MGHGAIQALHNNRETLCLAPVSDTPGLPPRPAVFLDRDGVINENLDGTYVQQWATFRFLPGAVEAIADLHRAGYPVVVVTNQAGIARGYLSAVALEEIHQHMITAIRNGGGEVMAVLHCPHRPEEGCECRKPQPGMLRRAATQFDLDLSRSVLVGDHLTDIQAAHAAGCRAILVLTGRGKAAHRLLANDPTLGAIPVVADLAAAVQAILKAGTASDDMAPPTDRCVGS
jgi:D-glycero-D-manno-heptose 1,7-bisphosphate phosphatase